MGGFLAAALKRAGVDVVVVAREETAAHINRGGFEVESVRLVGRLSDFLNRA